MESCELKIKITSVGTKNGRFVYDLSVSSSEYIGFKTGVTLTSERLRAMISWLVDDAISFVHNDPDSKIGASPE